MIPWRRADDVWDDQAFDLEMSLGLAGHRCKRPLIGLDALAHLVQHEAEHVGRNHAVPQLCFALPLRGFDRGVD
jgi:hypothetical protein